VFYETARLEFTGAALASASGSDARLCCRCCGAPTVPSSVPSLSEETAATLREYRLCMKLAMAFPGPPRSPVADERLARIWASAERLENKLRPATDRECPSSPVASASPFELNDFYDIVQLQIECDTCDTFLEHHDKIQKIQEVLDECRKKMTESFIGAVFLWGAPAHADGEHPFPQFQRIAPDFTMMSWNVLCHR
jgi:hypothetical protein